MSAGERKGVYPGAHDGGDSSARASSPKPVTVDEVVTVEISGLGHAGEGVGRLEGFAVFIPDALPGDVVRARITEVKKNYARAGLLEVVTPSPERVAGKCPVHRECGGCQLQHMAYRAQLDWKRQRVVDALERIGGFAVACVGQVDGDARGGDPGEPAGPGVNAAQVGIGGPGRDAAGEAVRVLPTLGMEHPWHYRNKAQYPVGMSNGRVVMGFFARGTHEIVESPECYIEHPVNTRIMKVSARILDALGISVYDERTGRGVVRHVLSRVSFATGEAMVVLVTNGRELPRRDEFIAQLTAAVPQVVSISQNVNTAFTNVILGRETIHLWGKDHIVDKIGDLKFKISPRSFFQVNPVQTEVLYRKAREYADLSGGELVVDAYCGIGTIALFLADKADRVVGIEEVPEAIEDARENAGLNGVHNAEFHVGRVEDVLPDMVRRGLRPDVVVLDPPRAGCERAVLEAIAAAEVPRVVYVSCNPSSLARDLAVLREKGYRTVEVQPVDMFPHTSHVECCCCLRRQS